MPVVSSLATDSKGQTLNVNSDTMAQALAVGLKAKKLILFTNVPGVLDKIGRLISEINVKEVNNLINKGIVTGGMIPKIKASAKRQDF